MISLWIHRANIHPKKKHRFFWQWEKFCQMHNRPGGWVLLTKETSLGHITFFLRKSWPNFIFLISTSTSKKYQPNISQNLDQTKLPFYLTLVFYMHLVSFKLCVICFRTSLFLDAFAAWTNKTYFAILKKSDPLNILSGRFTASNGGSFQDIQFIWQVITLKSWELRPNLT